MEGVQKVFARGTLLSCWIKALLLLLVSHSGKPSSSVLMLHKIGGSKKDF